MNDEAPRLLADGMLGRLAKWLRLLGYDTAFERDAEDLALAHRARSEGRVLLTRDRELGTRRNLRSLLIESESLEEQVRQVQEALGPPPDPALSRCAICNLPLEPTTRDDVADRIPPYVLRTQNEFRECPGCGRVYWPGTHLRRMREQLAHFNQGRT